MLVLFCFVLFSNATSKIENVVEVIDDKETLIINQGETENAVSFVDGYETSDTEKVTVDDDTFGCGSQGNFFYDQWRAQGFTHRQARELRRAWVRDCRGNGPCGWLNLCF